MNRYLYTTNTLTNNEIDMSTLQSSMGVQRQVGILHQLPKMPLQCEGGEIEMPRKDLESRAKYARQYYLLHQNEKHEYDKAYRQENIEAKAFKDKIYRILHADEIRIQDIIDLERTDKNEHKREYNRQYRLDHSEELKASSKQWYLENKPRHRAVHREWRRTHRTQHNQYKRNIRVKFKELIHNIFGNICNCSGELWGCWHIGPCQVQDIDILQKDHINGNGREERRSFGGDLGMQRFYLRNPKLAKEKLQLLCANCNIKKKFARNEI